MSERRDEPELGADRLRRVIRRRTVLWFVAAMAIALFSAGNWMTLAVDGGGSVYTWAMAIGGAIVAAAALIFIATFRYATRSLRRAGPERPG